MDKKTREDYLLNRTIIVNLDGEVLSSNRAIKSAETSKYLEVDITDIDKLLDVVTKLKNNNVSLEGKIISININKEAYLSKEQCIELIKSREILRNEGADIKVLDGDFWNIEDVLEASSNLDDVVDRINNATVEENGKDRHLNEYEKFLLAYRYVTHRKYHENTDNLESSRHITSIYKNNDIVCVGFATLLKEICNRIGVECYTNSCIVEYKNQDASYGHANNMVVLGGRPYYCDACWDCIEQGDEKNFNYCLIPFEDTKHFKRCSIVNYTAPFMDFDEDKEQIIKALNDIKTKQLTDEQCFDISQQKWFSRYVSIVDKRINKHSLFNIFSKSLQEDITTYLQSMNDIMSNMKEAEPISIEKFELALSNVYKALGKDEVESQQKINAIIQSNIDRSGIYFDQEAKNCFAKEYNKSLEL